MSAATLFLPSCREVTDKLSDYLEGQVGWRRGLGIRIHLGMCPACRRFLESLRSVPALLKRVLEPEAAPAGEAARQALDAALARIGQPRIRPRGPFARIPDAYAGALSEGAGGPTLELMAAAQAALLEHGPAAGPPFLPDSVLSRLPSPQDWRWTPPLPGGVRLVRLCQDAQADLYLLRLAPDARFPNHTHRGGESLLLLQGGLEDGDTHFGPGDWAVQADGSSHAPRADRLGCWALGRLEGEVEFTGALGLLQKLANRA